MRRSSSYLPRSVVSLLGVVAVASGCKKSVSSAASPLGSGAPKPKEISVSYENKYDRDYISLSIPCANEAKLKLTRPAFKSEFTCSGSSYQLSLQVDSSLPDYRGQTSGVFGAVEAVVTKKDGTVSTLTGPLELNKLGVSYMVRAVDPPQPNNTISIEFEMDTRTTFIASAHGHIDNNRVLGTIEVAEGIKVSANGKELSAKTANGVSSIEVEIPLDRASFDRPIATDAGLVGSIFPIGSTALTLTPSKGEPMQMRLLAAARMEATVLKDQVTSPLWFVNATSPAAKLAMLLTPSSKWSSFGMYGGGPMSQLGVVAIAEPGELKHFSPCRYQGGYTVHRSAESTRLTAYNPRNGQVLGTRVIEAKAPKCDSSIGVRASDGANFGNRSEVDMSEAGPWLLSLVP